MQGSAAPKFLILVCTADSAVYYLSELSAERSVGAPTR